MKFFATLVLVAVCSTGTAVAGRASDERPAVADGDTDPAAALPPYLRDTGLYQAGSSAIIRTVNLPFSPQYPLWSDGTKKRRWVYLPPGTTIDAANPDEWEFPTGTRLWKEFSLERPIETRMIERLADGSWRYASYVWNDEGTDAALAPAEGVSIPLRGASGRTYTIPSRTDCLACHEGGPVPVLGFSALQLSPDRDPLAPHAEPPRAEQVDLRRLSALGRFRGLPRLLVENPPRVAASTSTARAALGYLHGNCGHCHNSTGALAGIDLVLAHSVADAAQSAAEVRSSLVDHASRFRPPGAETAHRVVPGGESVLTMRMKTSNPFARMPPLGVSIIDVEGIALIERWIHDLQK